MSKKQKAPVHRKRKGGRRAAKHYHERHFLPPILRYDPAWSLPKPEPKP